MSTLTLEEQAAPSTPGTNKVVVYALAEGLLYAKDDAGTQRIITVSSMTSSLGADVNVSTTSQYFDGPSIPQGTAGTWFVCGTVTVQDTAGGGAFMVKLYDGTTAVASARGDTGAANAMTTVCVSGYIISPAGNLRIAVKDVSSTSGKLVFNATGNSKDCTITGIRIA